MVSTKKKVGYSAEKLRRAGGAILPIFSRDSPSDLVNEVLREDEEIRNFIIKNPDYKIKLEERAKYIFDKNKGVMYGARVIDSWDRVTSAAGLVADVAGLFTAGVGNVISAAEEIPELIPKAVYGIYYVAKTGDVKSIPLWTLAEAASFIPFVGDAIDMTNIYINRARKIVKKKLKKEIKDNIIKKQKLEEIVVN